MKRHLPGRTNWAAAALCLFCGAAALQADAAAPAFPGKKALWRGYDRYTFSTAGRTCFIVAPKSPAAGRPWVWRARFFGHEPQADLALLERGFHVGYVDVAGLYGAPKAVQIWDAFYERLTREFGFAKKPALEGMSRGGLIIYNWAAKNPDKVSCIYGDAPVCDIRSWPGGRGKGRGSKSGWAACLRVYGLTEEQAAEFRGNPIDNLKPLAEARVPILHVCGGADRVVPIEENTKILEERYKALGGSIQVIVKPGCGHHPHSLKDPAPIVKFILAHTRSAAVK